MSSYWTREELLAYILLFAAHSNLEESNHERNVIISKVNMNTFQEIHDEFDHDNDYQSIQKIKKSLIQHDYSQDDLEALFIDIKTLFLSDGRYDAIEQGVFTYLKRILE